MPNRSRPVLLSLLGASGSGKTTLAAALVRRWTSAGLRVGYVKHASHGFDLDRPGKDTDRLGAAGAAGVAVTGPGGTAYLERGDPADPASIVARFFGRADVVILEGFREHGLPAVVLVGDEAPASARAAARGPVLALVAGRGGVDAARAAAGTAPVFAPGDEAALAAHLEHALRPAATGAARAASDADADPSASRGGR